MGRKDKHKLGQTRNNPVFKIVGGRYVYKIRVWEVNFESNLDTSYNSLVTARSVTFQLQLQLHGYSGREDMLLY